MQVNSNNIWGPRLAAFALAALAAASAAYWVLRGTAVAGDPLRGVVVVGASDEAALTPDPKALARLLGSDKEAAAPVPAGLASRVQLIGVVADKTGAGAALLAVDGKPAKAYSVGSKVVDGLLLQAVGPRRALLAPGKDAPAVVTLEMKALTK